MSSHPTHGASSRRRQRQRPTALQRAVAAMLRELQPTQGATLVYLVRCTRTGLIKIGKTGDLAQRMGNLQRMSASRLELVAVMVDSVGGWLEAYLHDRFAKYRTHGEWFELPKSAVIEFAKECSTTMVETRISAPSTPAPDSAPGTDPQPHQE